MQKSLSRDQRGMSLIGFLIVVALVIFTALLAMKLGPYYLRHNTIKSVLDGIRDEPGITKMAPGQIKDMVMRRLDINSVYNFDRKSLNVTKDKGFYVIAVDYEVREHVVGNADALLTFKDKTEIPIQ
ncbi:MAG: DUF4845 domain-containing protein [Gammaproteobacteria bacterium]|nr:DUF4845 domain-containing protein [Gammaproteobacteria bacterium]MBU1655432.1 DUF4845 domain-containing protein [Gammaproteobacteria bacterium]MBU1960217.1 DUF4845 domain-containing protein [Gammaproteobacteria bacterium]